MDRQKNSKNSLKSKWSLEEDEFLREQANMQIKHDWVIIASRLKEKFIAIDKTPKQCRQRFVNSLSIARTEAPQNSWTDQEYAKMMVLFESYGFKWTKIAAQLETKTQNNIKNKFYSSLRKLVRRINNTTKTGQKKFKKNIRFQSVLRIISISKSWNLPHKVLQDSSEIICHQILHNMKQTQFSLPETIIDLGHRINKFNLETRSFKCQKPCIEGDIHKEQNILIIDNRDFDQYSNLQIDQGLNEEDFQQDLKKNQQGVAIKIENQNQVKGQSYEEFINQLENQNSILVYFNVGPQQKYDENIEKQEDIYLEYFKNVESPLSFSQMF